MLLNINKDEKFYVDIIKYFNLLLRNLYNFLQIIEVSLIYRFLLSLKINSNRN